MRFESIDGFFDTLVRDAAGFSGEGLIKLGFALEVGGGWELVLACELLGVVWNTMEQQLPFIHAPNTIDLHLLSGFALNVWYVFLGAACYCRAKLYYGADRAERIGFLADGRAELHHGLVVIAWGVVIEYRIGCRSEGFDRVAVILEAACVVGESGEDAHHVAIHYRCRVVLCDRANGSRGVGADAG